MNKEDVVIGEYYLLKTSTLTPGVRWTANFPDSLKSVFKSPIDANGEKVLILEQIEEDPNLFLIEFDRFRGNAFRLGSLLMVEIPKTKAKCKCDIDSLARVGCKCGNFVAEMTENGRVYNKHTRAWD